MAGPRVLVFTCSYNRPHMLRSCIMGIQRQTYKNVVHSINMTLDADAKTTYYGPLFDDLLNERTILNYSQNAHQHLNHIRAITNIPDYESYDIFVKVDDDDVYKAHYLEAIVAAFLSDPTVDITSSIVHHQLNGHTLIKGIGATLGGNPPGSSYHMPPTFAFNRRTLAVTLAIKVWERAKVSHDLTWRRAWTAAGLRHVAVANEAEIVWHIHGKNISTSFMLL